MRDQTKLIFNMGAEELPQNFRNSVIATTVSVCGGCYIPSGLGIWNDEDQTHSHRRFAGNLVIEDTLVIEVTCENEKLDFVYGEMRAGIVSAAETFGVEINWVHVSEIPMRSRHFSVLGDIERNILSR